MIGSALLDLLCNGREAVASGNADPYATFLFNDVVKTADGEVAITVRNGVDEASVRDLTGGGLDTLATWCAALPGTEIESRFQRAGVPAGRVQNAHDLFTADEQLAARSFFSTMDSPVFGERPFERFPAIWSESVLSPYRRAPAYVGEHSFEVLAEMTAMDGDEIALAIADGRLA